MILNELDSVPSELLPVQAFSDHLRLGSGFSDDGSENSVLETYLRASLSAIEARTGKAIYARRFAWTIHRWRDDCSQGLPIAPVTAIESVTVKHKNTAAQVVSAESYNLVEDAHRPAISTSGSSLPALGDGDSAEIVLIAGLGSNWAEIAADMRQAVMMLAATYFDHRHGTMDRKDVIPLGVQALLEPYRCIRIGGLNA